MRPSANFFDKAWTAWLPILFLAVIMVFERIFGQQCFVACEDGPVENFQALIAFAGFFTGVYLIIAPRGAYPVWARVFFTLGTLTCLYIGLEEISYGQRIFGWATSSEWSAVNDQDETNLHNTSSWFDQKPRLIIMIGIFIGSFIIPALRRRHSALTPERWAVVYPERNLLFVAVVLAVIKFYDVILAVTKHNDWGITLRDNELQEVYIYYYLFLYLGQKKNLYLARPVKAV